MSDQDFAIRVAEQVASELGSGSAYWDEAGGPEAAQRWEATGKGHQFLLENMTGERCVILVLPSPVPQRGPHHNHMTWDVRDDCPRCQMTPRGPGERGG